MSFYHHSSKSRRRRRKKQKKTTRYPTVAVKVCAPVRTLDASTSQWIGWGRETIGNWLKKLVGCFRLFPSPDTLRVKRKEGTIIPCNQKEQSSSCFIILNEGYTTHTCIRHALVLYSTLRVYTHTKRRCPDWLIQQLIYRRNSASSCAAYTALAPTSHARSVPI